MRRAAPLSILLIATLLFTVACPDPSWAFLDFSKDTWKTTGIVIGITAGVLLLVVLIAGTVTDIKRKSGKEEEDIWAYMLDNRTLACFPDILAGPVFLQDMKQALAVSSSATAQDLSLLRESSWDPPKAFRGLNPALYHLNGGSGVRPGNPSLSTVKRPYRSPADSARFAVSLLNDATHSDCTQ